jgi:hypothetical protein
MVNDNLLRREVSAVIGEAGLGYESLLTYYALRQLDLVLQDVPHFYYMDGNWRSKTEALLKRLLPYIALSS